MRQRGTPAAAARAAGRQRGGDRGARPRARHRLGPELRRGARPARAGRPDRPLHRRRGRGARADGELWGTSAWTASSPSIASCPWTRSSTGSSPRAARSPAATSRTTARSSSSSGHVAAVEATRTAVPLGRLTALVFVAGVGSLATEIAASRLLAPYFGNSTVVWANVIGLVLASLSLGYWLGGRLADRRPDPRILGGVVAGRGCPRRPDARSSPGRSSTSTVEGLDEVSTGAAIGSFFGVLILFAPPVVLLGMVAPFAIRLGLERVESAGAVAGRLYAVSTIGSLLGTFLSALVLIPLIGTQRTLLASAALLALAGASLLGVRWLVLAAALAALLACRPERSRPGTGVLHEDESLYQFVQVTERAGARRLYLDEGVAVHSVWRPGEVLTGGVWDTFLALPPLLGAAARAGRDPRQRGRDDREGDGRLLPRGRDRRRRAGPRRDRGGPPLPRAGRQPEAEGAHGRRAAVPAPKLRRLRPDRRRRLPPAVRPVLPRDSGVLRARPQAPRARRDRRAERRFGSGRHAAGDRDRDHARGRAARRSGPGRRCASTRS